MQTMKRSGTTKRKYSAAPDAVSSNGHGRGPYRATSPVWRYHRSVHRNGHQQQSPEPASGTPLAGPKFAFTEKFQSKILRLCLEQPEWTQHLQPGYFDDPMEGQVLQVMQRLYRPGKPIPPGVLYDACVQKIGKPSTARVLRPIRQPLSEADRAYLLSELPRFAWFQNIGLGILKAARLYQAHDVDGLFEVADSIATPPPGSEPTLALRWASDIEMKRVDWQWPNRLARGYLHLLAGDGDEGKSLITCDLVFRP